MTTKGQVDKIAILLAIVFAVYVVGRIFNWW